MLAGHAANLKIDVASFGPHALWATAATNALDHEEDIAKCRNGLGLRISQPRAFTTGAKCVWRMAQLSSLHIRNLPVNNINR